jgi:hypothetical protein
MFAGDGAEQSIVSGVEEVETRVGAALMVHCARQLVEFVASIAGIVDGGEKLQIAAVGGCQQFAQRGQAVDGLLHGGPLGLA